MEAGKWEELNTELLVDIFRRVGMESLLLDVPLVCKSWYKASLDPMCWKHLHFPKYIRPCCAWDYILTPFPGRILNEYGHRHYIYALTEVGCPFPITSFIKFVVKRSNRCATELSLSICCHEKALTYTANECPALKALYINALEQCSRYHLPSYEKMAINSVLLNSWKNLEKLDFGEGMHVDRMIASAIVTQPKLKYLVLQRAFFYKREYLVMILKGCKEIVHLDVRNCISHFCFDAEILKLASYIPVFIYEGSIDFYNG